MLLSFSLPHLMLEEKVFKNVHAVGAPYSNSFSKRWMFFICFCFGSCMLRKKELCTIFDS